MCHSLTSTPVLNPSDILCSQFFVTSHNLSSPFAKGYSIIFTVSVSSGNSDFTEEILGNAALYLLPYPVLNHIKIIQSFIPLYIFKMLFRICILCQYGNTQKLACFTEDREVILEDVILRNLSMTK